MVTDLSLDQRVGDYMSKEGGDGEEEFEAEPRKPYEVSEDTIKLYKRIIKENVKPKIHKDTVRRHDKAHSKALETLIEKVETLEKDQNGYVDEFHVKEALAHALITYRKEAKLPVSEEEGDFHHVYQAVDAIIENIRKEGKIDVDKFINEGRYGDLFHLIHQQEFGRVIRARLKYGFDRHIPHRKEHTFYQELVKAHMNEIGEELSEGDLAKIGRDELIEQFLIPYYDKKMPKTLEKYMGRKARGYHEKHGGERTHTSHGANNTTSYEHRKAA